MSIIRTGALVLLALTLAACSSDAPTASDAVAVDGPLVAELLAVAPTGRISRRANIVSIAALALYFASREVGGREHVYASKAHFQAQAPTDGMHPDLAASAHERLASTPGIVVGPSPQTSIVTFRAAALRASSPRSSGRRNASARADSQPVGAGTAADTT